MSAPRLTDTQPITVKGDIPHMELLIFIALLADYIDALDARIAATEAFESRIAANEAFDARIAALEALHP